MERKNVMLSILAITIQLDNTKTHADMQGNHQNKIENWWKEARQQVGMGVAIKKFILT